MTQNTSTDHPTPTQPEGSSPASADTKEVAREEGAHVRDSAADAGQHVASVAKDQARSVAGEAGRQAQDLLGQARTQVRQQATDQQQRAASSLRSLGGELDSLANNSEQSGLATDLARQASGRVHDLADWLERHDPDSLLDEVRSYARRRPGAFLAVAAGAGLLAGRLTRGLRDEAHPSAPPSGSTDAGTGTGTPAYPAGGYADPAYADPAYGGTGYGGTGYGGTGYSAPDYPAGSAYAAGSATSGTAPAGYAETDDGDIAFVETDYIVIEDDDREGQR